MNSQNLTEEQIMIQEMAMNFAKTNLLPFAPEWDENKYFPKDVIKQAADLGFATIYVCI